MRKAGFTLVELSTAMAVLSVVSLLSFIVVRSTTETADLSRAKSQIQGELRDVMTTISDRVQEAVTEVTTDVTGAPENLAPIDVSDDGKSITFQIPIQVEGGDLFGYSNPITISLETEDAEGDTADNGKLDEGEDLNEDGILNRRVTMTRNDVVTVLGSANNISDVQFQLIQSQDASSNYFTTLRVWLQASARHGYGAKSQLIRAELESRIQLRN